MILYCDSAAAAASTHVATMQQLLLNLYIILLLCYFACLFIFVSFILFYVTNSGCTLPNIYLSFITPIFCQVNIYVETYTKQILLPVV